MFTRSTLVRLLSVFGALTMSLALALSIAAQSPNTGGLIVSVVDPNDAAVQGANIKVVNMATGEERNGTSSSEGTATFVGLPLNGEYKVSVDKSGFAAKDVGELVIRAGETAQVKMALAVSGTSGEVTIVGTAEGVRNDPQIGRLVDTKVLNNTPILGRKFATIPLLNSAFRQGKGTGDLFVNQTYFITGVGSRRATTFTVDGASNDEGWGRQIGVATMPIGGVQEVNVMTNAFSAEFGWTSGPALNIVTKSGTNLFHGEALFLYRPGGGWQADEFSTDGFCPISSCTVPTNLQGILPVDIPDKLAQVAGSIAGPIVKDKTFFFVTAERTHQDRTTFLSPSLPSWLLPPDGNLDWTGHYRQTIASGRIDHHLTSRQNLMARFHFDQFYDDNPQDAVGGTNAPSVARRYSRKSWTLQANHTAVIKQNLVNEFRFAYLHADPVTKWDAATLSTIYTRGAGNGAVPFTVGQSRQSDLFSKQYQFADTLSWTSGDHYVRFGASIIHHQSGGTGNEPGALTLGTFTFLTTGPRNTLPLDQLTLADVQNYQQPINFGVSNYDLGQWLLTGFVQDKWRVRHDLTLDLGLRYDRQTLTDATLNWQPRLGFAWNPGANSRTVVRGGYAMYYTQIRVNALAGYLINGLDGITNYTANPGQVGFPTCLFGACLPVNIDPHVLPPSQIPARDITIVAGKRAFYQEQFARYGLNFDRIAANYPDELANPRSQVLTIGIEHEFGRGLFVGTDYVHQQVNHLDRTVDLNAPTPFTRTGPGQCRSANCNNGASQNLANLTRPILPVAGGVRNINTFMNLGDADYNGLQSQIQYRGSHRYYWAVSYTLSKATNTTEPDGNGIGANESHFSQLGDQERGPSVVDQRHRLVLDANYHMPLNFTVGTLMMFASARPFNATTGVDNNGDGAQNDRPWVDGGIMPKSAFRGRSTQDVSFYVENRIHISERTALSLRFEGFNILNHANMLGRGVTVYGNGAAPTAEFGRFVSVSNADTFAIPAFANIDPPRMFQLQARFIF